MRKEKLEDFQLEPKLESQYRAFARKFRFSKDISENTRDINREAERFLKVFNLWIIDSSRKEATLAGFCLFLKDECDALVQNPLHSKWIEALPSLKVYEDQLLRLGEIALRALEIQRAQFH